MNCCLGPYIITSETLTRVSELVFIDYSKSRLICHIRNCHEPEVSYSEYVLINVGGGCPAKNCDSKWYESPNEFGRTYTLQITPCEVYITKFEHGLDSVGDCHGSEFGAARFCFGKIYTSSGIFETDNRCSCSFIFDGHHFKVDGNVTSTGCEEIADCSDCQENEYQQIKSFSQALPEIIPDMTSTADASEETPTDAIVYEDRVIWHNIPGTTAGQDAICEEEQIILPQHPLCGSYNSSSTTVLPSGHAVVAYESRTPNGITEINLAILPTSVKDKIYYYRSLSRGTISAENNTLEVYDDFFVDTSNNVPSLGNLRLGFLTGPLSGYIVGISSVERITQDGTFSKNKITFSTTAAALQNYNNAHDISWFIILSDDTSFPSDDNISAVLTLPKHIYNNVQVPVARPSIETLSNNKMIGGENFIFITYQAFENNQWNVYLQQICLNDNEEEVPSYNAPYQFSSPSINTVGIDSVATLVQYKVKDISEDENQICAIFEVFLLDGRQVINCDEPNTDEIFSGCNDIVGQKKFALVSVSFNKLLCPSETEPEWQMGQSFTGIYPPTAAIFDIANGSCIDITLSPSSVEQWCTYDSSCTQHYVFEDPYCPSPYLAVKYYPEDLWTFTSDNETITRVLYHMSTAILEEEINKQADIMFLIDYSTSTVEEIEQIKMAIPQFAQNLANNNIAVRFGLTIFARGINGEVMPSNLVSCHCEGNDETQIFDGLELQGVSGGFTSDVSILVSGMNDWSNISAASAPYSAIQFCTENINYQWNSDSQKYIFMVTDTGTESAETCECGPYINAKDVALTSLLSTNTKLILATCQTSDGELCEQQTFPPDDLVSMSEASGWTDGIFLITGPYDDILLNVSTSISSQSNGSRIVERDISGYDNTFIKNAEIIISYAADLTELWTYEKSRLSFIDLVPEPGSATKGLTRCPFDIATLNIFGADPVHMNGNHLHWVYFDSPGQIDTSYPDTGFVGSQNSTPILISQNALHSVIKTNNRNDLFVVYESLASSLSQIEVKGTGDFCQNSITGPKSRRLTRFFTEQDFSYFYTVTSNQDGVNSLPDMVVDRNDVVHLIWQSNKLHYWNIYYVNGCDMFNAQSVTKTESKSTHPSIGIDGSGTIFVTYQDNRFGKPQIFLGNKNTERVIPLLEQDAYLASFRNNYNHYTNIIPLFIENKPDTTSVLSSNLWGSKTSDADGNDGESGLFLINTLNGNISDYTSLSRDIHYIAFAPDGNLYGVSNDGKLWSLYTPSETRFGVSEIRIIGTISLSLENNFGDTIFSDFFTDGLDNATLSSSGDWVQAKLDSTNINEVDFKYCNSTIGPCLCGDTGCSGLWVASSLRNYPTTENGTVSGRQISNTSFSVTARLSRTPSSGQYVGPTITMLLRTKLLATVDLTDANQSCYLVSLQRTFIQSGSSVSQVWSVNTKRNQNGTTQWESGIERFDIDVLSLPDIHENDLLTIRTDIYNITHAVKIRIYLNNIFLAEYTDNTIYPQGNPAGPIFYGSYYGIASSVGTGEYPSTTSYISAIINNVELKELASIPSGNIHNILDITSDYANRLWMLISEKNDVNTSVKILQINPLNAQILSSGTIFDDTITKLAGGLTSTSDGSFWVVVYRSSSPTLYRSVYPTLSGSDASFNFQEVGNLDVSIKSLASSHDGEVYGVDEFNDLYIVTNGESNLQFSLTTDSGSEMGVGSTSSISFQLSNSINNGQADYFHIIVEFYNNINFDGTPIIIVDSRNNLEAFINDNVIINEYGVFGMDAKGIFLNVGQVGIVFFDATHFRPLFNNLSRPYGFDANQTYFPKIYTISSTLIKKPSLFIQENSFSCTKCNRNANNNFNTTGCNYSFVFANEDNETNIFQFQIDFYADLEKQHLIRRYELTTSLSEDLQYGEIDNVAAASMWSENGIVLTAGQNIFVQIYPALDNQSGLICNTSYTVQVNKCKFPCIGFSMIEDIESQFLCDCASSIFDVPQTLSSSLARWQTSSNGYSDTLVSDNFSYNTKPKIKVRSTSGSVILWNKTNDESLSIAGGTFDHTNQDQLRSSGTGSWFDYDFSAIGKNMSMNIDLFDRIGIVYEREDESNVLSGEIPRNSLFYKTCDFLQASDSLEAEKCDLSQEDNIISSDNFIPSHLIKKIKVKDKYVQYYTYNVDNVSTPIVSTCNVELEIYGTPEVIAVRLRNEDSSSFSEWCPWSPEISDYHIEKNWTLSFNPGIKQVCVQVMTYSGITSEFCLPIIADYAPSKFIVKFYKDDSGIGQWPEDEELVELPDFDGLFVASLKPNNTLSSTALVEIIPFQEIETEFINFHLIQQGVNDLLNQVAIKSTHNGKVVFKGFIPITKEDNMLNIDGIARVYPILPNTCQKYQPVELGQNFIKDKYNDANQNLTSLIINEDILSTYRQELTGRLGVNIDIRNQEDPYFIFGNPDYVLQTYSPEQTGIPVEMPQNSTSQLPDEDDQSDDNPDDGSTDGPSG